MLDGNTKGCSRKNYALRLRYRFGGGQGLTITENLTADGDTLITGAGETVTIGTTGDGNISGDGNFIGMSADHSTTTASKGQVNGDIVVSGDVAGDSNELTVKGDGSISVSDAVSGDGNTLTAADGDITIQALSDNVSLTVTATEGAVTVLEDSAATLASSAISAKGVGADAVINLTNGADMDVTADASLGHVTAGSGSEVRLNPGTPTGTATASTLAMGAGSTLHIDTTDGTAADAITITESVSIATPGTVYVNGGAQDALAAIDGDTSVTIIKLEEGAVNEGVSEDVKFDMDDTQRVLQDKNMSLVSAKDGVQLVISDNFRSVENTAANQTAVNDTMKALSAAADHSGSTLADSDSKLDNVLDALDNTRSTASVKNALQSLSAAGNLVVPNMMMDTTRHHLSTLRSYMGTPTCTTTKAGSIKKGGNAWVAYTGGHDAINGDGATGDYTRTHQGAILGSDYSVTCNASVGLSLGYENSIGRMDGTRAISWNLGYEISRDVKLGAASTLTPFVAIDLSFHQLDTLNESGQGDASVTTNYDDPVQLDIAAGVAYARTFRSFTADSSVLSVSVGGNVGVNVKF